MLKFKASASISQTHLLSKFRLSCSAIRMKSILTVHWQFPDRGMTKLNTDGCSKGNPGPAGGGGLVRDSKGHVLLAFSHYYGVAQSITAEVRAILDGLRYCLASGIHVNYIESDSQIVVNVLKNQSVVPWRISHWIEEIKQILSIMKSEISHVPRECNAVADRLANFGCSAGENLYFSSWTAMPSLARGAARLDKIHLPSIRLCYS